MRPGNYGRLMCIISGWQFVGIRRSKNRPAIVNRCVMVSIGVGCAFSGAMQSPAAKVSQTCDTLAQISRENKNKRLIKRNEFSFTQN